MPFGLPGSGNRSNISKSLSFKSIKHNESGRLNMSGILYDGNSRKSSKNKKQQQQQQQQKGNTKQTPPRSKSVSGNMSSHRILNGNRNAPHHFQPMMQQQQQQHPSPETQQQQQYSVHHYHGNIPHNHSNNSQGSRQSSHSKHSNNGKMHRRSNSNNSSSGHSRSSSSGNSRQYHQHQHHNRIPSGSSDIGSVHSLHTVTSRSTSSDPSGHARSGGYYYTSNNLNQSNNHPRRSHSTSHSHGSVPVEKNPHHHHHYHNSSVTEHRDPYGETTNTRRTQYNQYQSADHHHYNHQSNSGFHTPVRHQSSSLMIKPTPTPVKSSNASIGSHHSRGSTSYNNTSARTAGTSEFSSQVTAPRVSTDKYVIKSTKKVIEELRKSANELYPTEKRIIALTNACAEFDHLDDSRHNLELQNGAAFVLCKVLAVILNNSDVNRKDGRYDSGIERDYEYDQNSLGSDQSSNDDSIDEERKESFTKKVEEDDAKHNEYYNSKSSTRGIVVRNASEDSSNHDDNDDDALRMIATALEMVFRGQPAFVYSAYDKFRVSTEYEEAMVGPTSVTLLPLILRLLDRAEGLHNGHQMKQHNADVTLANSTKVLLYLSRVPELRIHLARQPSLLDALSRVANNDVYGSNCGKSLEAGSARSKTLNGEARATRVRIIANLVNEEENKTLLLTHGLFEENCQNNDNGTHTGIGVLNALLRVAHMDPNDRAREYAGLALMDLASSPSNQITMAKNGRLLGTLVKMILVETNSGTRESAITALQNLAFAKENRMLLVSFKHGIVLEALIKALSNYESGFNEKSRRRAAGALTNLACDESAEVMGKHKGLLRSLAIVSTKDESPEVQTRAAMALTKLAASVTVRMESDTLPSTSEKASSQEKSFSDEGHDIYSTLLDALVVASLSPVSNSVSAVLRVKARDPENRYLMARHPGILDTLADMCLYDDIGGGDYDQEQMIRGARSNGSSGTANNTHRNGEDNIHTYAIDVLKDRDNATRALMHLTNEPKNRVTMCSPPVLNALVRGASVTDEEIQAHKSHQHKQKQLKDVRDSAIRAIERLATEFSNRHTMAHHEGMLVAIARATEREAKLEAQLSIGDSAKIDESTSSISSLALATLKSTKSQQQEQPPPHPAFLAKPLLMILLVAM